MLGFWSENREAATRSSRYWWLFVLAGISWMVFALRYVLGVIFIATGIVALFTPGGTFVALAAIVSFFFVFAGSFDIVAALARRSEDSGWWFQLLAGIAQVALGFWAAGNWTRSVVLLVAWVAASAMFRGVAMIIVGFQLRGLRHELDAVEGTEARERGRRAPEPRAA